MHAIRYKNLCKTNEYALFRRTVTEHIRGGRVGEYSWAGTHLNHPLEANTVPTQLDVSSALHDKM